MMRLRVHHLLCSALYAGKGYSEEFCENMQKVVRRLWGEPGRKGIEEELKLIAEPDEICTACPNLSDNGCELDDNRVVSKDEALLFVLLICCLFRAELS